VASASESTEPGSSDCDLCGPAIELTNGGRLTLRHSSRADLGKLRELYRRLEPNDLRRRFFTAGPPTSKFLEGWASLSDGGGFGLVAEVDEDGKTGLVGEAGYATVRDGGTDGELGITVIPGSRGWIGPWLLDRLLAHAHQRGVANLQAAVLVDNRNMMTLAAKRGYAILGHPDWGTVRITMSTSGSIPSWPGDHDRPRVLVETDHSRWVGEEALADAGFDIAICADGCRGAKPCPVDQGEPCPLIDGADAIVVDLRNARRVRELLHHEQVVHPGIRQITMIETDETEDGAAPHRLSPDEVIDHLSDLLADDRDADDER